MYLGDIHGRLKHLSSAYQMAEAKGFDAVIQVGDFGFGFPNCTIKKWAEKRSRQSKWSVKFISCGGNHDNQDIVDRLSEEQGHPDLIELVPNSGVFFAKRGSCVEIGGIQHLFLGGAESIDKHLRTEGVDFWEREEPSREEFELFFSNLEKHKPDTVVTHDAPLRVPLKRTGRSVSHVPNMLENVLKYSSHKPSKWYFGHHHVLDQWQIEETKFYCCGLHGQKWIRE